MHISESKLTVVSKKVHKLNPDCVTPIDNTGLFLTSFYTLDKETNIHSGEIQLSNYEDAIFKVDTPGIFDLSLINEKQFLAGDVDNGLSLWNIDIDNQSISQAFRTELGQKVIYVDQHRVYQENLESGDDFRHQVNVAVSMEQGFTKYLQLDEKSGEFRTIKEWKDATNTIWACKLLQDGNCLVSGGDFGKFHYYDLRTQNKTNTITK